MRYVERGRAVEFIRTACSCGACVRLRRSVRPEDRRRDEYRGRAPLMYDCRCVLLTNFIFSITRINCTG